MPPAQDALFAILGVVLVAMLAFDIGGCRVGSAGRVRLRLALCVRWHDATPGRELLQPGFHLRFSLNRIVVTGLDIARNVRRPGASRQSRLRLQLPAYFR